MDNIHSRVALNKKAVAPFLFVFLIEYCMDMFFMYVILTGVVLGEDHKKFKTRSGDTVRLVGTLKRGVVL